MLEQLNGLLNTTAIEEGVEAGLEYADSFGPWGRIAAVGITFGVTAVTTLLMMNKCRARSPSKDLSNKVEDTSLESECALQADSIRSNDDTSTNIQALNNCSLSDSESESDDESNESNNTDRLISSSCSPRR